MMLTERLIRPRMSVSQKSRDCSLGMGFSPGRRVPQGKVSPYLKCLLTGVDVAKPKSEGEETLKPYMSMYAYWLNYPQGWNYPAACASGKAGKGKWAASIDFENSTFLVYMNLILVMSANDEGPGKCAGCTGGGCSYGGDNYNV